MNSSSIESRPFFKRQKYIIRDEMTTIMNGPQYQTNHFDALIITIIFNEWIDEFLQVERLYTEPTLTSRPTTLIYDDDQHLSIHPLSSILLPPHRTRVGQFGFDSNSKEVVESFSLCVCVCVFVCCDIHSFIQFHSMISTIIIRRRSSSHFGRIAPKFERESVERDFDYDNSSHIWVRKIYFPFFVCFCVSSIWSKFSQQ